MLAPEGSVEKLANSAIFLSGLDRAKCRQEPFNMVITHIDLEAEFYFGY